MAPRKRTVTTKILQSLLTRIGSTSSGTKATLQSRFLRDLQTSRLFNAQDHGQEGRQRPLKIMSIDMGIKNLAYCVANISYPETLEEGTKWNAMMDVERWQKIDLLSHGKFASSAASDSSDMEIKDNEDEDANPYSPSTLSLTAYTLVTKTILAVSPDVILIEKQRWRSGGGNSVLQWTVRVNTLEAMLWAVLMSVKSERALQDQKENGFNVWGVDPKRVGEFWLGSHSKRKGSTVQIAAEDMSKKKPNRSKAEKRAKIALLREWLAESPPSTMPLAHASSPKIRFGIGEFARGTRDAIFFPRRKSPGTEIGDAELKKLDDVTDCFLQATAWVAWESNRKQLVDIWERGRDVEQEREGELSSEVVLAMVDEVGGNAEKQTSVGDSL